MPYGHWNPAVSSAPMTAPSDTCPSCLASLPSDSLHCPSCGAATPTHGAAAASPGGGGRRRQLADALGDNYIVGDLIGRGGFADVYRVADLELQRDIAVKVLRSDFRPSEEMAERFKREAQAVARLRHPGIIPIYSVGKAGELLYFTMPLIEGETLRDLLAREKRLPVDEVLRILREMGSALETAHRAGLVHRDLKPENTMLEGPQRRVLIMDFGIAKAAEAEGRGLTQTGMVIGTPQYMSPEQARGDQGIDSRADIYSLGVMVYQMLSGVLPFEGSNLQQILAQHVLYRPPELATLRSGLPPALADMVHRCLNKNRDERWSSVTELLAELDLEFGPRIDERLTTSLSVEVPADLGEIKRGEWIALSAAGAIGLIGLLTSLAFRPAPIDPPTSFERADSMANAYLASRASGAYEQAREFVQHDSIRAFLVEAVGRDEARRIAWEDVAISFWRFKWYRPGRFDTRRVGGGGDGLIHEFERPLEETVEGASLSQDSARAIAGVFLTEMGWDLATLEVLSEETMRLRSRTDHEFEWDDPGSVTGATDEHGTRRARERISILVSGEEVTNYHHFLSVDDESGGGMDPRAIVGVGFFLAIVLISIWSVSRALRRRVVNWRHPIALAAFAGILFVIILANASNLGFSLPAGRTWVSHLLELNALLIMFTVLVVIFVLILAGASLVLPRQSASRALLVTKPCSLAPGTVIHSGRCCCWDTEQDSPWRSGTVSPTSGAASSPQRTWIWTPSGG